MDRTLTDTERPGGPVRVEAGDRPLDGILALPRGRDRVPLVVLVHGFKGFMEWGFFEPLAELLVSRGLATLRFNFGGSGMRPGEDRVSDLEGFRANTFSREVEELQGVIEAAPGLAPLRIDPGRIGVLGHSRGGGMAVLVTAREESRDRIRALVTWNAIGTVDRLTVEEVARWRREGVHWVENVRTGQRLPLGIELLEDAERNREALDIHRAAERREAPWLLLHGSDDATVPVEEARALVEAARSPAELRIVEGGDHTFGATHPFRGPTPALVEAMNRTQSWFRRWLGKGLEDVRA